MTHPGDNTNIHDGIEACRPGSDDLQLPEMSHVAEALAEDTALLQTYADVQGWDAKAAAAFRDVEPPAELQNRLLAALADERGTMGEMPAPATRKSPRHDDSSRRLLIGGVLAASLLMALGVGAAVWNWPSPANEEVWVATATNLHGSLSGEWETGDAPSDRPSFARLQHGVSATGWTSVHSTLDRNAVAYRLVHPRGTTATLFVFRPRQVDPRLPLAPPVEPSQRNSRLTTGVWTSDGLVYALVVDGGRQPYQSFLRSGSIAMLLCLLPLA